MAELQTGLDISKPLIQGEQDYNGPKEAEDHYYQVDSLHLFPFEGVLITILLTPVQQLMARGIYHQIYLLLTFNLGVYQM